MEHGDPLVLRRLAVLDPVDDTVVTIDRLLDPRAEIVQHLAEGKRVALVYAGRRVRRGDGAVGRVEHPVGIVGLFAHRELVALTNSVAPDGAQVDVLGHLFWSFLFSC